jgi:hypothetical protein
LPSRFKVSLRLWDAIEVQIKKKWLDHLFSVYVLNFLLLLYLFCVDQKSSKLATLYCANTLETANEFAAYPEQGAWIG